RQLHFERDAEELVERVREALNGGPVGRMPKASDLPDSLKPLVHHRAVEVRQHFERDAEELVERVPEALDGRPVGSRSWQGTMAADVADGDEEPFRTAQATLEVDPVTVRKALNGGSVLLRSWLGTAVAGLAAAAGLLLVGWIGLHWMNISVWLPW